MEIIERSIKDKINVDFKEYALYTINNRAIPSAIDGLKPVQRKLLYSMLQYPNAKKNKIKLSELGGGLAKCLTGDNLVWVNGELRTIETVVSEFKEGDKILCRDQESGNIVVGEILNAIETKLVDELIEIQVGQDKIICTPDHRFLTATGEWIRADEITEGTTLA